MSEYLPQWQSWEPNKSPDYDKGTARTDKTPAIDPADQFTRDEDGYIRIAGWSRICRSCGLLEWLPIRHNPEHPGTTCPSCGEDSHVTQKTINLPPEEEPTP